MSGTRSDRHSLPRPRRGGVGSSPSTTKASGSVRSPFADQPRRPARHKAEPLPRTQKPASKTVTVEQTHNAHHQGDELPWKMRRRPRQRGKTSVASPQHTGRDRPPDRHEGDWLPAEFPLVTKSLPGQCEIAPAPIQLGAVRPNTIGNHECGTDHTRRDRLWY